MMLMTNTNDPSALREILSSDAAALINKKNDHHVAHDIDFETHSFVTTLEQLLSAPGTVF